MIRGPAKICVFGAGAVGSFLGASFAKAGLPVSAIARGAQLEAIRSAGLRVIQEDREFAANVAATDRPEDIGPQDLVLVTLKAPSLTEAAPKIKSLLKPETTIVFFLNGIPWWYFYGHGGPDESRRLPPLDPNGVVWNTLGVENVIGGVVYCSCAVIEPGVVKVQGPGHRFELGEPDGVMSERLQAVAAVFQAARLNVNVQRRIRASIWSKLTLNLASGPLAILSGSPQNRLVAEPVLASAMRIVAQESIGIAAAMGVQINVNIEAHLLRLASSGHKPSILQDLERRRAMEIDALYTVPLLMAKWKNVRAPTLELLSSLVKLRAASNGLYDY